jgi:hypothetical protein
MSDRRKTALSSADRISIEPPSTCLRIRSADANPVYQNPVSPTSLTRREREPGLAPWWRKAGVAVA